MIQKLKRKGDNKKLLRPTQIDHFKKEKKPKNMIDIKTLKISHMRKN